MNPSWDRRLSFPCFPRCQYDKGFGKTSPRPYPEYSFCARLFLFIRHSRVQPWIPHITGRIPHDTEQHKSVLSFEDLKVASCDSCPSSGAEMVRRPLSATTLHFSVADGALMLERSIEFSCIVACLRRAGRRLARCVTISRTRPRSRHGDLTA